MERFAEDEENEKVVTNFHPLSSNIVMFQRSKIPAKGQPLLAAITKKHPYFMAGCKLGVSLRKSNLQLLVAVLLDMQRLIVQICRESLNGKMLLKTCCL